MKKFLVLLLALVMCLSCFAACKNPGGDGEDTTEANGTTDVTEPGDESETDAETDPVDPDDPATLADAVAYLNSLYKDGKETTDRSFDVVARVLIGGITFPVTWTSDKAEITIKESDKDGFYTVVIPETVTEEIAYVLTATITDADGKTETKSFNRKVPVINNAGITTEPVKNTAYKFFMKQGNLGKTLFALGEMSGTKYIKSTNDAKLAPDFFVEKVDGGFKFYTELDGAKTYINARTETAEDGKVSKFLELSTEAGAVWTYDAEVNAWLTTIGDTVYCVGTYSSYDTFCISEKSYINAENSGVSQFPAGLITKDVAEAMTPDVGPADPTELTSIKDFNAIGEGLGQDVTTPEKYLVKGTIVEIKSTQYGNMYIEDAEGNRLYIYGLYSKDGSTRFDKMDPQPKVGDTITVMGVASNYNGPQMKNGWVTELVAGDGPVEPPKPAEDKTIPAFNEIASAQPDKGDATAEKYTVTGVITEIKNTTYGNLYIQDAEGNSLYIYGIYSADGSTRFDAMDPQPKVGDTITVVGVACNYNGPQMKNGWVTSLTEGEDPNRIPAWDEKKDVVTHQSFGELYINGDSANNLFAPGASASWDKVANLDASAANLVYWGWIATTAEIGAFSYQIDDLDRVNKAEFVHAPEDGLINHAPGGSAAVTRMRIVIDLAGLSGTHTVKVFYSDLNGATVLLNEFTVNMPEAPKPTMPEGITEVKVDTPYYLFSQYADGALFLDGTIGKGRVNGTNDIAGAKVVWLEATGTDGEYYLYFALDGKRVYIGTDNEPSSKTAAFILTETKDESCVWLISTADQGIVSKYFTNRGFATKVDSTYTNFSTYATSNFSDPAYCVAWLTAADTTEVPPVEEVAKISTDKLIYNVGEDILVTAIGEGDQWVGLYYADAVPGVDHYVYYYYVAKDGNVSGMPVVIDGPTTYPNMAAHAPRIDIPVGRYKLVLFADGGYTVAAETTIIDVIDPNASLTSDKETYKVGESIMITAQTYGAWDWVGIYAEGNPAYLNYYYPIAEENLYNGVAVDINALCGGLPAGNYIVYLLSGGLYPEDGAVIKEVKITVEDEAPAIDPADPLYPQLNGTYYVLDGYTARYTVIFTVTGEGVGTIAIDGALTATYNWTYTTAEGFKSDAENLFVGLNRLGQLAFQCDGLLMPEVLVTEIPEEPGDTGLQLGDNAIDVPAWGESVVTFTAPYAGTFVFAAADGETNGDLGMENEYGIDWFGFPYEMTLEAGETITLIVSTLDWSAADTIDIVITAKADETEPPAPPAIDPADPLYPLLNSLYYIVDVDGYTPIYNVGFGITEEGQGVVAVFDFRTNEVNGPYAWTYTTAGGIQVNGANMYVGLDRLGQLVFQCDGLLMPQVLLTEIPTPPVADPGLQLGNNTIDVTDAWTGVFVTFTAPNAGTFVFSAADGETNGDLGMESEYGADWFGLPYEVTLAAGESITLIVSTLDLMPDVIDIVITAKAEDTDDSIKVDTPYYISTTNNNGVIYIDGTINSGKLAATLDVASAAWVALEATENAGEYYSIWL